jgi:hypothetical protein
MDGWMDGRKNVKWKKERKKERKEGSNIKNNEYIK